MPALVAALVVLVGIARTVEPDTLLELVPVGLCWGAAAGALLWRFGFNGEERAALARQLRPGAAVVADPT